MTLDEHLLRATKEPWKPGEADCSTFPADWIRDQSGRDPMAIWRGRYSTEEEASALIVEAGGLLELFTQGIDPIWLRTDAPGHGTVGVISMPGEDGEPIDVGAIHTGRRWAMRSPRGLAFVSAPLAVRAMWAR